MTKANEKYKGLSTEQMVIKALAEILQKEEGSIELSMNLREGLEVDSLDTVELLMEAEEAYDLEIDSTEIDPEKIITVRDMVAFVEGKMAEKKAKE